MRAPEPSVKASPALPEVIETGSGTTRGAAGTADASAEAPPSVMTPVRDAVSSAPAVRAEIVRARGRRPRSRFLRRTHLADTADKNEMLKSTP
ncbi:hypothetical protein Mth01_19180 [Sphaerimonospora thailandensis]|uniref:Uncharacterized protein n=1 Tax=Sphaerimonospora thailandensis TaxID=795644 RepID=A0A8J3VZ37_9ACTN|nr:hypothetical protein Mth01_19180 [Sphaerimonospora thailandensis]